MHIYAGCYAQSEMTKHKQAVTNMWVSVKWVLEDGTEGMYSTNVYNSAHPVKEERIFNVCAATSETVELNAKKYFS